MAKPEICNSCIFAGDNAYSVSYGKNCSARQIEECKKDFSGQRINNVGRSASPQTGETLAGDDIIATPRHKD